MENVFDNGQGQGEQAPGLLGKKVDQKDAALFAEFQMSLREISRRLRILEERYTSIRKNIQVNEQNMLNQSRKNSTEIMAINSEISELKKNIRNFAEELKQIIKEVKQAVKKDEVKVLERYINLWQPISYVTHTEMDKRIREIVREEVSKTGHNI